MVGYAAPFGKTGFICLESTWIGWWKYMTEHWGLAEMDLLGQSHLGPSCIFVSSYEMETVAVQMETICFG